MDISTATEVAAETMGLLSRGRVSEAMLRFDCGLPVEYNGDIYTVWHDDDDGDIWLVAAGADGYDADTDDVAQVDMAAYRIAWMMAGQITMTDDAAVALGDDERVALITDDGLTVADGARTWVVWLQDDATVVVWAGNDRDPDMDAVVELQLDQPCCPLAVRRYADGVPVRNATYTEWSQSLAAAQDDGGRGVFDLNGVAVYVA